MNTAQRDQFMKDDLERFKNMGIALSKSKESEQHECQPITPIEWVYLVSPYKDKPDVTRVSKLRCICGKVTEL